MNQSWAEVNAAMLAVLAEWTRPLGRIGSDRAQTRRGQRPEIFADRLLGVLHAEGLGDRSEVRVLPGTIITPLARDILKHQGVAVQVVSGREAVLAKHQQRGEWGFAVATARHAGLVASLSRHWIDADWFAIENDPAEWVVEVEGRGALVLADEASVATWRFNQVEGIRAATVGDVDTTVRAVRHLGANLLVVEPITRSIHLIQQISDRFHAGGAPVSPEWSDDEWEGAR